MTGRPFSARNWAIVGGAIVVVGVVKLVSGDFGVALLGLAIGGAFLWIARNAYRDRGNDVG